MAAKGLSAAERIPPHDLQAEQCCLGSAMLSTDAALLLPDPADFYRPTHQRIASVIRDMAAAGQAIDQVTVRARMAPDEEVGAYLLTITNVVPTAANMETYGRIVRDTAVKRRLVNAGTNIARLGYEQDPDEGLSEAEKLLAAVPRNSRTVRPVGLLLADVVPERVCWLWYARIPYGRLTLLDGDPGLGKSTLALDVAARLSRGAPMPDGWATAPAGTVILSAEDGLADTIRPRLDAAGADVSRIVAVQTVPGEDRPRALPDDLHVIEEAIIRVDAKLVIVDPLMAFLSARIDGHRDQDVRGALHLLARLAEDTGAAVLVVRHLNKSTGGNVLYRGGGSIGIIGAARSGLLAAKDPDDEARRVLASMKCNLAAEPESLSFHIEADADACRIVWEGVSAHHAGDLLAIPTDPEERGAVDEARDFLASLLQDGPMRAADVKRQAREVGVSDITLRRAKKAAGVTAFQEPGAMHRGWSWRLDHQVLTSHHSLEHEHLTAKRASDRPTCGNADASDEHLTPSDGQVLTPESEHVTPTDAALEALEEAFDGEIIQID